MMCSFQKPKYWHFYSTLANGAVPQEDTVRDGAKQKTFKVQESKTWTSYNKREHDNVFVDSVNASHSVLANLEKL